MGILVTGGAGFIGAELVSQLIDAYPDTPITVLDALVYPMGELNLPERVRTHPGFRLVRGSVTDQAALDDVLAPGDTVIHMAVEMGRPGLFVETQVHGTKVLLDKCVQRGVAHFVFQSTGDVYGPNNSDDITEDAPVRPTHLYSATKLGAEALVFCYHHTSNLPVTVLRPVSIYGPRQYPGWLIARFCNFAVQGSPLTVMGSGEAKRDWIHVADICRAILAALATPPTGELYNIGTGREWSVNEIATMVQEIAGRTTPIERLPAREGDFMRQITRAEKAKRLLGWSARIPFEDGLRQTYEWYAANQDWVITQLGKDSDKLGFRVKDAEAQIA
jgi:dTDP-glucose 4,6-dehydratase